MLLEDAGGRAYGNSLYYLCNSPLSLQLTHNKDFCFLKLLLVDVHCLKNRSEVIQRSNFAYGSGDKYTKITLLQIKGTIKKKELVGNPVGAVSKSPHSGNSNIVFRVRLK